MTNRGNRSFQMYNLIVAAGWTALTRTGCAGCGPNLQVSGIGEVLLQVSNVRDRLLQVGVVRKVLLQVGVVQDGLLQVCVVREVYKSAMSRTDSYKSALSSVMSRVQSFGRKNLRLV
jgi:hypothetical protein